MVFFGPLHVSWMSFSFLFLRTDSGRHAAEKMNRQWTYRERMNLRAIDWGDLINDCQFLFVKAQNFRLHVGSLSDFLIDIESNLGESSKSTIISFCDL